MAIITVIGSGTERTVVVEEGLTLLNQEGPEQCAYMILGLSDSKTTEVRRSMEQLGLLPHIDKDHPGTVASHTGLIHVDCGDGALVGLRLKLVPEVEDLVIEDYQVPFWGATFTTGALPFEQMFGLNEE